MIGILEQHTNSNNNAKYTDATGLYSLRRLGYKSDYAIRISRSSDGAETDVLLPSALDYFIGMNSPVSAGGDLQTWIGSNDAIVKVLYNQNGGKDLYYTNSDFKLITAGVFETINGKPAINQAGESSGNGLAALGINKGQDLTDASVFIVFQHNATSNTYPDQTRPVGFGNHLVTSGSLNKMYVAGDNTLRFFGDTLNGTLPIEVNTIRASFKVGDVYSDYINEQENASPTNILNTNIQDDFYIAPGLSTNTNFKISEVIVYLSDKTADKYTIQAEQNAVYSLY